jgi:uncharacterized membrane protein YfcA
MLTMPRLMKILLLVPAAIFASALAAVTGFGGAAVLLPVLVAVFGVREAVPILTVAQLIGNGSRVWFNRRELDWRVIGWFTIGAVPLGLLGGYLFATAPLTALTRLLGVFLLLVVVWRHLHPVRARKFPAKGFVLVGAGATFLSALMGSVGPMMAPFFLAYGLLKAAYIGTEAMSTVVMHITKLAAYGNASILSEHAVAVGVALGPAMILGSWTGKKIVDRIPERIFIMMIEAVLILAGLLFIVRG